MVRIVLKKDYADGTLADMDPLSRLCRLATSVPPPRLHTIKYAGVLAPASAWRTRLAPKAPSETPADGRRPGWPERTPAYRPWAELLARTNGGKAGGPEAFAIAWWRAFRVGSPEG